MRYYRKQQKIAGTTVGPFCICTIFNVVYYWRALWIAPAFMERIFYKTTKRRTHHAGHMLESDGTILAKEKKVYQMMRRITDLAKLMEF